ncbi:MAG: hypothetical protein ACYDB8_11590 [Acidiferrobacterales bacterium]
MLFKQPGPLLFHYTPKHAQQARYAEAEAEVYIGTFSHQYLSTVALRKWPLTPSGDLAEAVQRHSL